MNSQSDGRLIVVSNRLPIVFQQTEHSWQVSQGSGGLVTALVPVLKKNGGLWIGWPGTSPHEDVRGPLRQFSEEQGYDLMPVPLHPEEVQGYYHGFSNEIMWPLLHGLHGRCHFHPDYYDTYRRVNQRFARKTAERAGPDDFVWVHDYHLMPLGRELKKQRFAGTCVYFHHVPFPGPDIFLKLPWHKEMLEALLDYQLVGFQTSQDCVHFLQCLNHLGLCDDFEYADGLYEITAQDRRTRIGHFPISIDFQEFAKDQAPKSSSFDQQARQKILLGVDRLDYTKGIPERLESFRLALRRFPDLRGKISLRQIVVPSRQGIAEYQNLKQEIERLVGEINGEFAEPDWVPIHYLFRSLKRDELIASYQAADIALVTPLCDGMNLVAKEYCAAKVNHDGVLILSEFAGAAAELSQYALMVNPYGLANTADVIRRACYMHASERRSRMQHLRSFLREHDIFKWLESFRLASRGDPFRAQDTRPPDTYPGRMAPPRSSAVPGHPPQFQSKVSSGCNTE